MLAISPSTSGLEANWGWRRGKRQMMSQQIQKSRQGQIKQCPSLLVDSGETGRSKSRWNTNKTRATAIPIWCILTYPPCLISGYLPQALFHLNITLPIRNVPYMRWGLGLLLQGDELKFRLGSRDWQVEHTVSTHTCENSAERNTNFLAISRCVSIQIILAIKQSGVQLLKNPSLL